MFGFRLRSELELPGLAPDGDAASDPDVVVSLRPAPRPAALTDIAGGVAAGPGDFWMEVPDVVRLHVTDGCAIAVEIGAAAHMDTVRAFLLGSAMGALLQQRGLLPLHASAVAIEGRAVAFVGTSGAGKSTLALHLSDRGHTVLCDDICAVEPLAERPLLHPGTVRMKLWAPSLSATGRSAAGLHRVLPALDKYMLPMEEPAPGAPVALDAVMLLDRGEAVAITDLPGAVAASALIANTFRGELVAPMRRAAAHFAQCMTLARHPGVRRLVRPWALDGLDDAAQAIERYMAALRRR